MSSRTRDTARPLSAAMTPAPAASSMAAMLWRMPRSPSTVRFTRGSGRPCGITPARLGSPEATECTSVVAPPGSTTSSAPSPASPSQPSASRRAPSITAAGVGISTRSNIACARSMPLACTMRSMNTSRIAARAGSMLSTLNSGITFSVTITALPASRSRH